jgi:hypothetical protein
MADKAGLRGGSRDAEPIGLDSPSKLPPQPSLPETLNDALDYKKIACGRCEIGLYRTAERLSYDKTISQIHSGFGSNNVNAYVTMSVDLRFVNRRRDLGDQELFQAYLYIDCTGPFLPKELTKDHENIKRTLAPPATENTAEIWEQIRNRLILHEHKHFTEAMATFHNTIDENVVRNITTYEAFERYMKTQQAGWNPKIEGGKPLPTGFLHQERVSWDDKDAGLVKTFIDERNVENPLERARP